MAAQQRSAGSPPDLDLPPRKGREDSLQKTSDQEQKDGSKRRRIAVACTHCRNRKSRCNGSVPCSLCEELGLRCVYEQPRRAESRHQSRYNDRLQTIEDTLALLVQQQQDGSARLSQGSSVQDRLNIQDSNAVNTGLSQTLSTLQQGATESQHAAEDTIDGMAAVSDPNSVKSKFFGLSSNIAFLKFVSRATSTVLKKIGANRPRSKSGTLPSTLVSRAPSPSPSGTPATSANGMMVEPLYLPPEDKAHCLMLLYFSNTGTIFPFIDEQRILNAYTTARKHGFYGVSRSQLCILNLVFAFATFLNARPKQGASIKIVESESFYQRAHALATSNNDSLRFADIETVQALLLMSQWCQGSHRPGEAWHYHGRAIHTAIQIGLHSPSDPERFSPVEREVRKRVWFACFLLDSTVSMTFGRPSFVSKEYLNKVELPVDVHLRDLLETSDGSAITFDTATPNTTCFFTATINLYKILGSIISNLYENNLESSREDYDLPNSVVTRHITSIEQELFDWRKALPSKLLHLPWKGQPGTGSNRPSDAASFDRLSVILRLRYLNTRILLHRRILDRTLGRLSLGGRGGLDEEIDFSEEMEKLSINICRSCAIDIIDTVYNASTSQDLLGAWWFSLYYTFNASLVIYSCLLLNLSGMAHVLPDLPPPSSDQDQALAVALATKLRLSLEAVERINHDAYSAKRMQKTLNNLIQICATIAQLGPQNGTVVVSALYGKETSSVVSQQSSFNIYGAADMPATLDMDISETLSLDWMQSGMEIFGDLDRFEPGFFSMAG